MVLEMLFLKDYKINYKLFAKTLYASYNKSYIGLTKEFLERIKIYDSIEILNQKENIIGDLNDEIEQLFIIKLNDKRLFLRLLYNDLRIIYDILIYDNFDYEKFVTIFFSNKEIELDSYLKDNKSLITVFKNNHLLIIKNQDSLLKTIGYEAWDFNNKFNNNLDLVINNKNIIELLNTKKDFNEKIDFICNGDMIKSIDARFKYYNYKNSFYIIDLL